MKRSDIKSLYYITHFDNVQSILQQGILSHALVEKKGVRFTRIYDEQIVKNRRDRMTPDDKSLWEYANLYFQPRNPMLYRVINEKDKNDIVILGVRREVLNRPDSFVSTGNAASAPSDILPVKKGLKAVFQMWNIINSEWWNPDDGSKRKIMAECLVPDVIAPDLIHTVYVAGHSSAEKMREAIRKPHISVVPEPRFFFQPTWRESIAKGMSLVEGDMFFSTMHTLTISVNTVGVMGKGLASRAKYQFPDVYVVYQDACREKTLQMGKPYLYKRESFVDEELAEDSSTFPNPNSNKWFLLFATKRHWKERSDIEGIEEGLRWIRKNYRSEGINSLAIPALGCGLGGLEWGAVGPLICRYLSELDIKVAIYLPREHEIPKELLSGNFLLSKAK